MKNGNQSLPLGDRHRFEMQQVELAKKNPQDFGLLYSMHFESIFRFLFHRLPDKQIAKDLAQQVFVKALVRINTFQDKGFSFSSWLFRIAVNEFNKYFEGNKKDRTLRIDDVGLEMLKEETQQENYAEMDEALFKALEKLNEEQLLLVEMRFFEKMSFAKIAEILEITENNAKTKCYRSLEKLKQILNN